MSECDERRGNSGKSWVEDKNWENAMDPWTESNQVFFCLKDGRGGGIGRGLNASDGGPEKNYGAV